MPARREQRGRSILGLSAATSGSARGGRVVAALGNAPSPPSPRTRTRRAGTPSRLPTAALGDGRPPASLFECVERQAPPGRLASDSADEPASARSGPARPGPVARSGNTPAGRRRRPGRPAPRFSSTAPASPAEAAERTEPRRQTSRQPCAARPRHAPARRTPSAAPFMSVRVSSGAEAVVMRPAGASVVGIGPEGRHGRLPHQSGPRPRPGARPCNAQIARRFEVGRSGPGRTTDPASPCVYHRQYP